MKQFFLLIVCCWAGTCFAQPHDITVELPKFANQKVYLGFYYGSSKGLQDSVVLDANGKGHFKGNHPLSRGIYFLVSPQKEIMFELLIPDAQKFSIQSNSSTYPYDLKFTGSDENQIFYQYTLQSNFYGQALNRLYKIPDPSPLVKDSIQNYQQKLNDARKRVVNSNPNSMIAHFLKAMEEPAIPPASQQPGGKFDTAYVRKYFKENYWGPIDFTDAMYLRTPFFESKLNTYFTHIIAPVADSIIKEVDYMLAFASVDAEMYRYLLMHFVSKYIQPQYMGQDAVFIHLFEKHIAPGNAGFIPKETREYIDKRAYSMMANQIGNPAPALDLIDINGKNISLYKINAPLTVICFWDPTCSHCKELMPKLDSVYQKEWKPKGIVLLAVNIGQDIPLWKDYIKTNKIDTWTHAYRDHAAEEALLAQQKPGYKQLYDIFQTPLLYLVDDQKRIVAKRLNLEQLNEMVKLKL